MPADLSSRIKAIQKIISVKQTGEYDATTINKLVSIMNLTPAATLQANKESIQKKLGFTGKDVDGLYGVNTTTKIEFFVSSLQPAIPIGASMIVSKAGLDLIVQSEVSGESAYNSKYQKPIWPKTGSGVTIGIGYDLGCETAANIAKDWSTVLSATDVIKLKAVAGLRGDAAKNALANDAGGIKSVTVSYRAAKEVFYVKSMPGYAKQTRAIYPGVQKLPPDAQAALLSIVYNRGADLKGDRRMEMKNIVPLVAAANLAGIAAQIRAMKRLWTTPDTKGLVTRREKEAELVENATFFYSDKDIVIV